jgi:glycosyltransferase involved in cell wall biosynthesis
MDTLTFALLSAVHVLRADNVDIAHIHGIAPAVWTLLPRLRAIKTVVHIHSTDWRRAKWGRSARLFLRLGEYAAVRWSDAAIAVSPVVKDYLENRYGKAVHYVSNGVDILPTPEPEHLRQLGLKSGQYLLFMGRLVPEKGCHYLLEAVRRVNPPLPLVMAGGESHSREYMHRLEEAANSQVRFLGYATGPLKEELLAHACIYIQPSDLEGMSLTLLEAMSYGRCIIMSDIPENTVVAKDCAVTFRAGDVNDLTEQLASLLRQPQRVQELGRRAKRVAASHQSWNDVATEVEAIYRLLLQPGRAADAGREAGKLS